METIETLSNSDSHDDIVKYFYLKAKQLYDAGVEVKLEMISLFSFGGIAYFNYDNSYPVISLYLNKSMRGNRNYFKYYDLMLQNAILITTTDCGLEDYFVKNGLPHMCFEVKPLESLHIPIEISTEVKVYSAISELHWKF